VAGRRIARLAAPPDGLDGFRAAAPDGFRRVLQLMANGVPQTDVILAASNAVDGQDARARHVDAGSGSPAVIVADEAKAGRVLDVVRASDGVGVAYLLAEGSPPIITDAPAARPPTLQCGTGRC
jgi:F420-dependent methylenetetrahydromethanopterin dehydrogenase